MSAFDKVIGYGEIKKELILYCDVMKDPDKYANLGVRMPRGILLHGDVGLGKTLMASCFIEESGCKCFTIRKDRPAPEFINKIKEIYCQARHLKKAIVFLDDMDKFANPESGRMNSEEFVTVQSCIDSCADSNVLTIATINNIHVFPKSLLREGRFDRHFLIEEPKGEEFEKIIKRYLSTKKVSKDISVEEIERLLDNNSCATLETVINDAGIYAGYEGRELIEQRDIVKSCKKRIFPVPSCAETLSSKQLKLAAAHEAGHALLGEILSPGSVNYVAINVYANGPSGVTKYRKESDNTLGAKEIEHKIMRCLGGKAAVELLYGITDLGAEDDLLRAHGVLYSYIEGFCLYNHEYCEGEYASQFMRENRDRRLHYEMDRLYVRTKELLNERRWDLEYLARELYDNKFMTFSDINIMNHVDEIRDKSEDHDDLFVYN